MLNIGKLVLDDSLICGYIIWHDISLEKGRKQNPSNTITNDVTFIEFLTLWS